MNRNIVSLILTLCLAVVFAVGCEVQSMPANDPDHSDAEMRVSVFASTIDPYETYTRTEIYAMLEEFMHVNQDIYASGFAVTNSMSELQDFYYIYKDGTTYITMDGFDYESVNKRDTKYLKEKVAAGEQFWSQQYVREDGSGNMINVSTFFTPIVNDVGKVMYVLTIDRIEEIE